MSVRSNSFKKNTILLLCGTILNKGVQFLVVPLFSRWLSAEEYGRFDLFYTYVLLLIPVITLSTHEAMFRYGVEENNYFEKRKIISGGIILVGFNFFIVTIVSLPLLWKWETSVYLCFMMYLITELFATYLRGYLRAIKKLDIYSFAMIISTIAMAIAVTLLVYIYDFGFVGIMTGYTIGTLVGNIVICIWSNWFSMLSFGKESVREIERLIKYALPLVPNDISWWVMNASDRHIINVYFGDFANGIYAIAHKIPALCSVIFNMFSISWQQEVIEKIEDSEHNNYFNSVFNKMLVLLLSFCSCLLSGSWILYFFVFDMKYFRGIQYTPILIASAVVMALSQFLGGIQIALKKPRENGITTVVGAICNVFFHLLIIEWLGLYAAAISTFIANIVIFVLRVYLLKGYYKISIEKNTWIVIGIFTYFFVMTYQTSLLTLNAINVCMAIVLFLWFNKSIIRMILTK